MGAKYDRPDDGSDNWVLPHHREVAVGGGAVNVVGDGLRGGYYELNAGAGDSRRVQDNKIPGKF